MIRFVYDLEPKRRDRARAAIDALVDPILRHLPAAEKASEVDFDALNVHLWHDYPSDVFMSHGLADKGWRDADLVADFTWVLHSGPAWERKYRAQGMPAHKLRMVGYAKLDPLFDGTIVGSADRVLWAPSLSRGWQREYLELEALLVDVDHALHPHDAPGASTLQQLADAAVVIADVGSTLYEAWALGKPVVFPDYAVRSLIVPGTFEAEIYERGIGYHADTPAQLMHQVDRALDNGITDAERDFIEDIFPASLRGTSGKAHADALQDMFERVGDRHAAMAWAV